MSRSRVFLFTIQKIKDSDWIFVCNLKKKNICNYIFASKHDKEIKGFLKFNNARYLSSVNKIFNNRAIIENKIKSDEYYKELYSESEDVFDSSKNNELNCEILYLIQEKDNLIKQLVETQLVNQEDKDKLINQLVENQTNITKQISEICLTMAKNSPTIINNSTNTVKFNLNMFLNEHCKDAFNLVDFAKSIQIRLEDILLYKKLGHVEAVTQIFDKAYKNLDINMRPIHCTDVKRETLYVKNDNKWINDETKELSEKAMDIVSNNSFNQLKKWKDVNPDYTTNEDKKQEYILLMKQLIGGSTDREMEENLKKIIKNLSKNTQLDKEQQKLCNGAN